MKHLFVPLRILVFSFIILSCSSDDIELIRPLDNCIESNDKEVESELLCSASVDTAVYDEVSIFGKIDLLEVFYDFCFYSCGKQNSLVFVGADGKERIFVIGNPLRKYGNYKLSTNRFTPDGEEINSFYCYQPDRFQITLRDTSNGDRFNYTVEALRLSSSSLQIANGSRIIIDQINGSSLSANARILLLNADDFSNSEAFIGDLNINNKSFKEVFRLKPFTSSDWLSRVYINTTYGIVGMETADGKLWALERME